MHHVNQGEQAQQNEQGGGPSGDHGGGTGGGSGGDKKINVAIGTTAGFFPKAGFDQAPVNQKVQVELAKAAEALNLTSTTGWIVTVPATSGLRVIDAAKSYTDNKLSGEVTLDWGPSEGGGGAFDASGRVKNAV
jgi:hypothetical protein